ncbi:hypothetical protein F4808DRAFT_423550 [Astrocystis sublimbata]|nr:hypothetical protein F4808DRAFT_423550 [Astrocystis sublimbata]
MEHSMEHNMEHSMEPLMDFQNNLPEVLAVDLQQSSSIFQSRHLTAGAPAPGLADGRARNRPPPAEIPSLLSPTPLFQHESASPSPKSLQTIHKKYSDIFAPLDFDSPRRRGSTSSSDFSVVFESPSMSPREESVLTVDTWLEAEKSPIPILLHITPTSEFNSPMSWIDLDGDDDDVSPTTRRRRSSMTDFPVYLEQFGGLNAIDKQPSSPRPHTTGVVQTSTTSVGRNTRNAQLRRSSLIHQDPGISWRTTFRDTQSYSSFQPPETESAFMYEENAETGFNEDQTTLQDPTGSPSLNFLTSPTLREGHFSDQGHFPDPKLSWDREGSVIASQDIDYEDWVESDTNYFVCREKPAAPRQLSRHVQDSIEARINNFPHVLLSCDDLLVEEIRELSQQAKYNPDDLKPDHLTTLKPQPNNQRGKPSRWKLLGNATSTVEPQHHPDTPRVDSKQAWAIMGRIFPHGSDIECEALYAYVFVYNYLTSLYLREVARSNSTRPNTGRSGAYSDSGSDSSVSTPPRPSGSETGGIPRKAFRLLGLGSDEDDSPRPPSGASGNRISTFNGLRQIPSMLFNQGQQRLNENRGCTSRCPTPAGDGNNYSRPATPAIGRIGTSLVRLAGLRRGIASCCAGLTVALQSSDPNMQDERPDKYHRVDPSFMRSLCQHVQINEDTVAFSL